jgi:hypothetical protein
MHKTKVNTNIRDLSSPEAKKASLTLVSAHVGGATTPRRRPRRDLVKNRTAVRDRMLYAADFYISVLEGTLFRPVDHNAKRGLLEPAPDDRKAMRLSPEALGEFNALRQQLMDFVRNASIVRGPSDRQSLQLVAKEACKEGRA